MPGKDQLTKLPVGMDAGAGALGITDRTDPIAAKAMCEPAVRVADKYIILAAQPSKQANYSAPFSVATAAGLLSMKLSRRIVRKVLLGRLIFITATFPR